MNTLLLLAVAATVALSVSILFGLIAMILDVRFELESKTAYYLLGWLGGTVQLLVFIAILHFSR